MRAAADAAPQLMQLRQTKPIGVLDEHHRGIGHIHSHFDNRGGKQNPNFIVSETSHHPLLLLRAEPSVQQLHVVRRKDGLQPLAFLSHRFEAGRRIAFLHARKDDVSLAAFGDFLPDERMDFRQLRRAAHEGADLPAPRRQLVEDRMVKIPVDSQSQGTWDRRGRHHQQMWIVAFTHQVLALGHPKLVLLVDQDEPEVGQLECRLDQGMRADAERSAGPKG